MTHIELDFICGEKFQELADVFIGNQDDLQLNPKFRGSKKGILLDSIPESWDNPPVLFCYGNVFPEFIRSKLQCIKNPFTLIVGNSDENITEEKCGGLLDSPLLIHGWIQNLLFTHPALSVLPIGLANSHYEHGKQEHLIRFLSNIRKQFLLLSSFNPQTNLEKRVPCLQKLAELKIPNYHFKSQSEYLAILQKSCFCICPEGNGADVHRFWEAQILECVPICLKNSLTEELKKQGFPCVLLNTWKEFNPTSLPEYTSFEFKNDFLDLDFWKNRILPKKSSDNQLNIVFSFIGELPDYSKLSIAQLRLFYDGPIYLLYTSMSKNLEVLMKQYNVVCINVKEFVLERFNTIHKETTFSYCQGLKGREELFKLSYQRLYLLEEFMKRYKIKNVLGLELDILFYTDPRRFMNIFRSYPYIFSYHDKEHCNISTIWLRSAEEMEPILQTLDTYRGSFMSEMMALRTHIEKHETKLFPLLYPVSEENKCYWESFQEFGECIFDGAVIGQHQFGIETMYTNGKPVPKRTEPIKHLLNIWKYGAFEWRTENGLRVPVLKVGSKEIPIVNLHIHSKDLQAAVSKPLFYDVVSCIGPSDLETVPRFIETCNKNIKNIGTIWILTHSPSDINIDPFYTNVKVIHEKRFPFCIEYIHDKFGGGKRAGWYLQQLLKLYAPIIVEKLSENYIYVDADIFFHKQIEFFDNTLRILFNVGVEYHKPYFEHIQKLYSPVKKVYPHYSGICHHMPMKKSIVKQLIKDVEANTNTGKAFWELFLDCVDPENYAEKKSGASEYELLFNYTLMKFPNECILRPLFWRDHIEPDMRYSGEYEACHQWIKDFHK